MAYAISRHLRHRSSLKRLVLVAPTALYVALVGLNARAEPLTGLDVTVYNYWTPNNIYNSAPPLPTAGTPIAGTLVVENVSHSFDAEPYFSLYEDFVVRYVGHITAPTTGTIRLQALADDGTKLYVSGQLVADDWRDKGGGGSISSPIAVEAGESLPFELYYYENGGGAWIHLYWLVDGVWQIVPASAFTREPVTSTTTTSTVPETTIPETTIPETTLPETTLPEITTTTTSSTTTTTEALPPVTIPYVPPATTSSTTTTTTTEPETTTTTSTTTTLPSTTILTSTSLAEPSTSLPNASETSTPTSTTPEPIPLAPSEPSPTTPTEIVEALSNPETVATLTAEQATELFADLQVEDLSQQLADRLIDAIQDAPEEVRQAFEEEIDVYSGLFDRYVPIGSTIPVSTRRTLVAISGLALATTASVRIRR